MVLLYILIILVFSFSNQYKVIDLEPYRYTYYINDLENNTAIYKFQPQSLEKQIFISFLGHSNDGSFEFYIYSNIADINTTDNGTFTNYLEKIDNYGEIEVNHALDIYYILVKMNSYQEEYKYLSFMMYNMKEYLDIGKYNDYIFAFESNKNIIFNYPAKNKTQYLYFGVKGKCERISYHVYKNSSEPELVEEINNTCFLPRSFNLLFNESNNYYINITINTTKITRMVLYYLDNDKYIIPVKDILTDLKLGYISFRGVNIYGPEYLYFFIDIENVPMNKLFGYHIYEPLNPNSYKIGIKFYEEYNISEMPYAYNIKDFDYESTWYENMTEKPFILLRKYREAKGFFLKVETVIDEDTEESMHNEMIMYLDAKNIISIDENLVLNSTQLIPKNVFCLYRDLSDNLIVKSNLDYFTILYPKKEIIKSKAYLFSTGGDAYVFQFPNSENALIELQFVEVSKILRAYSPDFMYLCKDNTYEDKYIYMPYMTNFNILYGDVEIYDINVSSLNSLDDFYNENYMQKYNSIKRYSDYSSFKEDKYFYKIKCTTNSLIKYEDSFISYIEENITINSPNKKLILDFSKYAQKTITFKSDLPLYIGIIDPSEFNEDWALNFTINNISYFINNQNEIFYQEVKINDILIIEKPDKNIHVYIKTFKNYSIETFRPLNTTSSGLYLFDRNVTEEYNTLIYLTGYYSYGKYSIFYENPNNYEFNQLINYELEIPINPYKYLKEDDESKYFFLIYDNYSHIDGLNITKLNEAKMILNQLIFVENNDNEIMRIKLPKPTDDDKIVFIQYFDENIQIFSEKRKLVRLAYGYDYNIYIIDKNKEYFGDNEEKNAYKSYYFISYMNYTNNTYNYKNMPYNCYFNMENIFITDNKATIGFINYCSLSMYNYTVFIEYNVLNYRQYSPIKKYYEKDIDNNTKYYEFQRNGSNTIEILDTFKRGMILITMVGQDTEGFHRFVYARFNYDYKAEEEKSYLVVIIIASIAGAIFIFVVILCIMRLTRKKHVDDNFEDEKSMKLYNQKNEKENADFKDYEKAYYEVNDDVEKKEGADFKY